MYIKNKCQVSRKVLLESQVNEGYKFIYCFSGETCKLREGLSKKSYYFKYMLMGWTLAAIFSVHKVI